MGRLTLNVLLSFAQFEREVTGERIRDKIAASKQKGLWMGGTAPIGYVGHERTLAIDKAHAAIVKGIYESYLKLGSIRCLKIDLDKKGILAPIRYRQSGQVYGGRPFSRGNLQRILTSPVYTGKMIHFDKTYQGQHPAIIEQGLWDAVQAKIASNRQSQLQRPTIASDSILTGLLYDDASGRLSPSHTQKQSQRFRYYISQSLVNDSRASAPQGLRLPAQELETVVIDALNNWLNDATAILNELNPAPEQVENILATAQTLAAGLNGNASQQYKLLRTLVDRIIVSKDKVQLAIKQECFLLNQSLVSEQLTPINLSISVQLKRCGYAMRLIVTDGNKPQVVRDQHLIAHIAKAHQWLALFTSGKVTSIKEIATNEQVDPSHVTRMLHRAFLAPDIVRAILNGTQPKHLDLKFLKQFRALPVDWNEQRKLLGFK